MAWLNRSVRLLNYSLQKNEIRLGRKLRLFLQNSQAQECQVSSRMFQRVQVFIRCMRKSCGSSVCLNSNYSPKMINDLDQTGNTATTLFRSGFIGIQCPTTYKKLRAKKVDSDVVHSSLLLLFRGPQPTPVFLVEQTGTLAKKRLSDK